MTTNSKMQGGPRKGAGRPRKGTEPRVPVTFSVDPDTRRKAQELRQLGYPLNDILEKLVAGAYDTCKIGGDFHLVLGRGIVKAQSWHPAVKAVGKTE